MKVLIIGLLISMMCVPHAFASLSEILRVHSDVHAQEINRGSNEGRVSAGPVNQQDQGHG